MKWAKIQLTCLAVLICFIRSATAQDFIAVYGRVIDENGRPISKVKVDVCVPREGTIDQAVTDANGRYVFRVNPKSPFELLFTHDQYALAVVKHLPQTEHEQLSQAMYRRKATLAAADAHHQLQSYERFLVLAISVPSNRRREQFAGPLAEMREGMSIAVEGDASDLSMYVNTRIKELGSLVEMAMR